MTFIYQRPPEAIFAAAPDWSDPVTDTLRYLTNVLTADDDSEQRLQLREVPNRVLAWRVLGMTPRETATIDAMLYAQQGARVGVPLWPDVSLLTADAPVGATSLTADTTDRSFATTPYALLWRDLWSYELVSVNGAGVTSSAIALAGGTATTTAWAAGTVVVPLLIGHHAATLQRTRPSGSTGRVPVAFQIEVVPV